MIKLLTALTSVLFLAGCTQGDIIRAVVAEKGRQVAADALNDAEWWLCRASPIGALRDRYGRSETLAGAWRSLCRGEGEMDLIGPVRLNAE